MRCFGFVFLLFFLFFYCSSAPRSSVSGSVLYARNQPDKEYAVAQSGQPIYSKARVGTGSGRARVVYARYIFQSATKTELVFSYEEHYDRTKEQPDLKEPKTIPYSNGEAMLEDMKLVLFRVMPAAIEYKLEVAR